MESLVAQVFRVMFALLQNITSFMSDLLNVHVTQCLLIISKENAHYAHAVGSTGIRDGMIFVTEFLQKSLNTRPLCLIPENHKPMAVFIRLNVFGTFLVVTVGHGV